MRLAAPQGRPKKGPEDKFRLNPIVPRLEQLLGKKVGCTGFRQRWAA